MFFETLERREVMTVAPGDIGTIWETFAGNYVPAQEYKSAVPNFLTAPSTANDLDVALNYLKANAASFGVVPNDFNHYIVTNQYTDANTRNTHIYLQQKFNGLPVADAVASVHLNANGQIISAGANFVRNLANNNPVVPAQPAITAAQALQILANQTNRLVQIGEPEEFQLIGGQSQKAIYVGSGASELSSNPIPIELHYIPKQGGGIELAWKITALNPDGAHWLQASIGAHANFRVGQVIRLTDWINNAAYNVFPQPVDDILDGPRRVVIDPQDSTASPFGWHDINGVEGPEFFDTRGNNVIAREDINGNLVDGLTAGPSPILEFNDFLFLPANPATYRPAAITNMFYWINLVHDISYNHGFDEISGNFQVKNYTTEGEGQDAVVAFNQDPIALNNAFMATPPDGEPPLLVMGLTNFVTPPLPNRDTSLDSIIIVHEYTHGISNRLTGGPANSDALLSLQSGGMGEGWSDWLGLLLTIDPGDTKETPRNPSQWAFPFGLRRQPYSFDLAINGLTLDDFNGFDPTGFPNSEVHNAGEIWCSALWDLSWLMIERYGFDTDWYQGDGGNNRVMDLVFEGMKLQPANPSFTEARDAILAADLALNDNANFELIWQAFSRRGFGRNAFDGGGAASDVVVEDFGFPDPLTRVSGRVIEDFNGNGQINTGDVGLAGWTIYIDANTNSQLDVGERSTVSAADGTWSLPITVAGTHVIREIVQPGYTPTAPLSGSFTISTSAGANITNKNFLNRQLPGSIRGTKFNDLDGNGTRDPGEPGIQGVIIYVDLNKDGKIGIFEPAATTDSNGNYTIQNVRVGTDYHVREVPKPGLVQTFPDPADAATLGGAHVDVDVVASIATTGINFGNQVALDFGDAPTSYGTLLANNGPRHGVLTGFGLTLTPGSAANVIDSELNGLPHPNASGDDSTGIDDENGVLFLAGLVPGTTGQVRVGVRTTGASAGFLQGWIDFNRDGDFLDAGEKIFTDRQLVQGVYDLSFPVPSGASLGSTFARIRFGFERGLSPFGASLAGEVEDLATNILQDQAIATNDIFPDPAFGDPFIKLNSDFTDEGNSLDVLRNDFGTSSDPTPEIVGTDFFGPGQTLTTAAGGTVKFISATAPLQYRPKPGHTGADSFQYRVTAGGSTSSFATVSLTVSPSDPIAVDDIFRISAGAAPVDILVLANDLAALNQQISVLGEPTQISPPIPGLSLARSATGDKLILTRAGTAATFKGTVRFSYTIDDTGDPSTASSSAVVTIQITDGDTTPAPSHLATFKTRYLRHDPINDEPVVGIPVSNISLADSEFFWVEFVVQDLPGGTPDTFGVESAYLDLLISAFPNDPLLPVLVEPVLDAAGDDFVIDFDIAAGQTFPTFGQNPRTDATFSIPGTVQEVGGARGSVQPPIPPPTGTNEATVMRVKFRALGGGSVIVQADHADSPQLPTALFVPTIPPATPIPPLAISDDQVFIHKAGVLQIIPDGGEGEFTNRDNVNDVNGDGAVNQMDILLLVNDLSQYGPRSLNQLAIALSGLLPPGYLDVNFDTQVNTIDILNVINYLTVRGAIGQPVGGGAGEGESAGEGEGAGVAPLLAGGSQAASSGAASSSTSNDGDPLGVMVNLLAWEQSQSSGSAESETSEESPASDPATGGQQQDDTVLPTSPSEETAGTSTSSTDEVDTEAADELFSTLSSGFREQLRNRRLARLSR